MKLKSLMSAVTLLVASAVSSNAATFIITNANDGETDTLYANSSNDLMSGGIVALGYFAADVTPDQINTIDELRGLLGTFTIVTSIAPGSNSATLGGSFPGYADQFQTPGPTSIGQINVGNALLNRTIYTIVSSASSLLNPALDAEFALFQSGVLSGDTPNEVAILGSPAGANPLIGSFGTKTGDFAGVGVRTFTTLQMAAVPEPSAALLGAVGALGLLRRRRN